MGDYRQSYETPYNGGVAATGAGMLGASDQFSNTGPQKLNAQLAPVEGWAALHERWKVWDPNGQIVFTGVNTRTQKGVMQTNGKGAAGIYQSLPVPVIVGQSVDLVAYAQLGVGMAQPFDPGGMFGVAAAGLLLGSDYEGNAPNSNSYMLGAGYSKTSDASPQTTAALATGAMFQIPFPDGAIIATAILQNTCLISYCRYRLQQVRDTDTEYSTRVWAEVSVTGSDWLPLRYFELTKQDAPMRSIGWGLYQDGSGPATVQIDQFVLVEQAFSDNSATIGGVQIFGAV